MTGSFLTAFQNLEAESKAEFSQNAINPDFFVIKNTGLQAYAEIHMDKTQAKVRAIAHLKELWGLLFSTSTVFLTHHSEKYCPLPHSMLHLPAPRTATDIVYPWSVNFSCQIPGNYFSVNAIMISIVSDSCGLHNLIQLYFFIKRTYKKNNEISIFLVKEGQVK